MINLFDSDNYPTSEPEELVVGMRWAWTRPDITTVYPTATYTLEYRFVLLSSPYTQAEFQASKVSSAHVVENESTEIFAAGEYRWMAVIIRDSDSQEVKVDDGYVTVLADFESTGDVRSHTYTVLAAIRATIAGTATKDQSSYSVGGRSLARRTLEELTDLEEKYLARWNQEKADALRKSGKSGKSRVLVKMGA